MKIQNIKEAIRLNAPQAHCVYFLVEDDEIVYVGSTSRIGLRIAEHIYRKKFTDAFFIPMETIQEAKTLETKYILEIRPKYNLKIDDPNNLNLVTTVELRREAKKNGLRLRDAKRMVEHFKIKTEIFRGLTYYDKAIYDLLKLGRAHFVQIDFTQAPR